MYPKEETIPTRETSGSSDLNFSVKETHRESVDGRVPTIREKTRRHGREF